MFLFGHIYGVPPDLHQTSQTFSQAHALQQEDDQRSSVEDTRNRHAGGPLLLISNTECTVLPVLTCVL